MRDLPITLTLAALTLSSLMATILSFVRAPHRGAQAEPPEVEEARRARERKRDAFLLLCTAGSAAVFLYQWLFVRGAQGDWQPLESHVDGLALIAALLGASILYLQRRSRLPGLALFALPVLTLVLAWSICASSWTFFVFRIDSAWEVAHLAGVYVGTLFLALGAIAGCMYLFVQRRLRQKREAHVLGSTGRMASLEAIENFIVRSTGLGFCLLTLGIVAGLIVANSAHTRMGPGWWHSPKILLSAAAWLTYAMVLDVRHATFFRGARAAWMSIAGVLLILATFSVVNATGMHGRGPTSLPIPEQSIDENAPPGPAPQAPSAPVPANPGEVR